MQASGAHHETRECGDYWGITEAGDVIKERDGLFEIASWSRGRTGSTRLAGATLEIVEVYLARKYGDSWRIQQGWGLLTLAMRNATFPAGFEVSEGPDHSGRLTICGPPPVRLAEMIDRREAIEMAYALSVSLEDLIASYQHPDGLPSFPQV